MRCLRFAVAALAALTSLTATTLAQHDLQVGDQAPALNCAGSAGRTITWGTFEGRAVLLFFHNQDMSFSRRGLEAVTAALTEATDLHDKAALLVVTNGERDIGTIQELLDKSMLPGAVTVDVDRTAFKPYRVVAFPSVFAVTPDRTLAQLAKGYGPLLPTKVLASARLAAGLLDQRQFEQALHQHGVAAGTDELLKTARAVRMAEQLFSAGMLAEARTTLEKALRPDSKSSEGIALFTRVLLAGGDHEGAKTWLDRLAPIASDSNELHELRAELALVTGDAEGALKELERTGDVTLRMAWIRGRALQHLQRFREAAEVFEKALGQAVEARR